MSKRFREHQPEQMLMMPPSLQDWLPEGHLARFISDVVAEPERQAREGAKRKRAAAEERLREREQKAQQTGQRLRGRLPRIPDPEQAKPETEDKVNPSDPDSRVLRQRSGSFAQGFNAQAAVDGQARIIVAADVTQARHDRAQLVPMLQQVEQNSGVKPVQVSADTDYYSSQQIASPQLAGIDLYVKPEDPPAWNPPPSPQRKRKLPRSGYGPDGVPRIDHLRAKLATPEGQAIYAQRRQIVEPVFGQIKQWRGFRQFLLRGPAKTRAAWRLLCLTHNLLKLHRLRGSLQPA